MGRMKIVVPILMVFGLTLGCRSAQTVSPRSALGVQTSQAQMYLSGVFKKGGQPVLEAVYLMKPGEPQPWAWSDPPPVSTGKFDFDRHPGGTLRLKRANGDVITGSWDRIGTYLFAIPGGPERIPGWGWVALVPYVEDAVGYELFEGARSIGSERFAPVAPASPVQFTLHLISTKHPASDGWSDVSTFSDQPINQALGELSTLDQVTPQGTWVRWRKKGSEDWTTLTSVHPNGVRIDTLERDWPPQHSIDQSQPSLESIPKLPGNRTHLENQNVARRLSAFIISPEPGFPMDLEIQVRRSYGLRVFETVLTPSVHTPPKRESVLFGSQLLALP